MRGVILLYLTPIMTPHGGKLEGENTHKLLSKQTWVIALQRNLKHEHCNIYYEYIYMLLLFEGATITVTSRSLQRLFEGG